MKKLLTASLALTAIAAIALAQPQPPPPPPAAGQTPATALTPAVPPPGVAGVASPRRSRSGDFARRRHIAGLWRVARARHIAGNVARCSRDNAQPGGFGHAQRRAVSFAVRGTYSPADMDEFPAL